ncbi:MAG: hypothetical protein M3Y55_08305, partial [Pseudomonadota bacterium]|nr:hypothetical protein [Pseudomonadota bacterium]
LDLAGCEVPIAAVDRLELAAVDSDGSLREQPEFTAQHDEATASSISRTARVIGKAALRD